MWILDFVFLLLFGFTAHLLAMELNLSGLFNLLLCLCGGNLGYAVSHVLFTLGTECGD